MQTIALYYYSKLIAFFNNNEFKYEIKQIILNTAFGNPKTNVCFENLFNISIYTSDDHAPIKNLSKEEKPFLGNLWIGNYLRRYIRGVRDTYFMKYCVAKGLRERLKIPLENIIVRNKIKMEAE